MVEKFNKIFFIKNKNKFHFLLKKGYSFNIQTFLLFSKFLDIFPFKLKYNYFSSKFPNQKI